MATCACRTAPSREAAMVVIRRAEDGTPLVWCDPCLSELVAALNSAGIKTIASCCGHGQRPGLITLADGRHLIVADDATNELIQSVFPVDVNGVGGPR